MATALKNAAKRNEQRRLRARVQRLAALDPALARVIAACGPCTLEPQLGLAPFESLARAIAHQQLNGAVAARILERLGALYAPEPFPQPAQLLATPEAQLRACGFSWGKIRALRDLAEKTLAGIVPTGEELLALDDEAIVARITQVRGIGRWTVEMLLMFQLGRPDVLPVDDFGVRSGFRLAHGLRKLPPPRALALHGARWAPERTLAAWYLWRAVDLHKAGKLPEPRGPKPRLRAPNKRRKAASRKAAAGKPARSATR
jgi:DNA-3-methyladenine glycosylase II